MLFTTFDSPIGQLLLLGDDTTLYRLDIMGGRGRMAPTPGWERAEAPFASVSSQLDEYFAGRRREFDVPMTLHGNEFELRVWRELLAIPYAETTSYGDIARRIGRPGAARAVGVANARNPIAVIVPCHRVIGADGSLTGYGGGLPNKRFLLDLEAGLLPLAA
jgi:methylated-DNA-[protein]-cysteine S-methyltransferase